MYQMELQRLLTQLLGLAENVPGIQDPKYYRYHLEIHLDIKVR